MNAFYAIILDTWRQSKQQVVFILMIILLVLITGFFLFIPKVFPESTLVSVNKGEGRFRATLGLEWDETRSVVLGDLNGDGSPDIVCGNADGEANRVWLSEDKGKQFRDTGQTLGDGDTYSMALADVDGDGDLDLACGNGNDQQNKVYINEGKGQLSNPRPLGKGNTRAIALVDFNGDDKPDVFEGNVGGPNRVWFNDGEGNFTDSDQALGNGNTFAIAVADFDNDDDMDVLCGNGGKDINRIWLNDGKGNFKQGPFLDDSDTHAVAAGDFDGDGDVDIFTGNLSGQPFKVFMNDGEGKFDRYKDLGLALFAMSAGLNIQTATTAHLNDDGRPDIICGGGSGAPNHILLTHKLEEGESYDKTEEDEDKTDDVDRRQNPFESKGPPLFELGHELLSSGNDIQAIAAADLDHDDEPDIVAVDASKKLGFVWKDEPTDEMAEMWIQFYARTLIVNQRLEDLDDEPDEDESQLSREIQINLTANREAMKAAQDVPGFQRSVEALISIVASAVFTISMILFIAASAGYFPNLLAQGAIDVVLSRPVSRLQILLAKYVGGLFLYSVVILAIYFILFIGIGLQTGVWHGKLFYVVPLQVFSAAVLYAFITLIGVVFRSTTLAVILGLFLYLVVDTVFNAFLTLQSMQFFKNVEWFDTTVSVLRNTLPNFGLLKDIATSSVLNAPTMNWKPVTIAFVWLVICLGLSYLKFRSTDY